MRTFEHPNLSNNWKCPICDTSEDQEVVLIGINGTQNGGNIQAEQFHADCVLKGLLYYKDNNVIAQKF